MYGDISDKPRYHNLNNCVNELNRFKDIHRKFRGQ